MNKIAKPYTEQYSYSASKLSSKPHKSVALEYYRDSFNISMSAEELMESFKKIKNNSQSQTQNEDETDEVL